MRSRCLATFVLAFTLIIGMVGDSFADVSNAAVLFLRITPSARAAGMGNTGVAIADDAAANHFNPAGLGARPLSGSWTERMVPPEYRPLRAIASIKKGGDSGLDAWEIWASTDKGLIRFDYDWQSYEKFTTKTSQTLKQIVSSYFNVEDEDKLASIITKVAEVNNKGNLEFLAGLRDSILAVVPAEYSARASLTENLDSLIVCYPLCRLNWDQINEMEKLLGKGLDDGNLSEVETDRIGFAAEKARMRFILEDLKIPYDSYVTDSITAVASSEDFFLIGTTDGLIAYNGKSWRSFGEDDGLPSTKIQCLYASGKTIFVGTDKGVVRYAGLNLSDVPVSEQLPEGSVTAIGASGLSNIWIVLGGDLYHFNGANWSNAAAYTVVLADTPDTIAEKFALYGTPEEKVDWLAKFGEMQDAAPVMVAEVPATEEAEVAETVQDSSGVTEETVALETAPVEETTDLPETAAQPETVGGLTPGMVLDVPYVAGINEEVLSIHVDVANRVWLGTESGIYVFDGRQWESHGRDRRITKVGGSGSTVFFATDSGLVEYDGADSWRRLDPKGVGRTNIVDFVTLGEEYWIATGDRVVSKGNGRNDYMASHFQWLPELTDDLYYEYVSHVREVGGLGTFGLDIKFISYGSFAQTGETSPVIIGHFDAFDLAVGLYYGTRLTSRLSSGIGAKVIHSRLAPLGAGREKGQGISTGFALDFGLLYKMTNRLTWGMAISNLGPKMAYIDVAQADPLPRNLSFGPSYKLLRSNYYTLVATVEINKILVGLDDGLSTELKQLVINAGTEFVYAKILAGRAGYIYDDEGEVKAWTLGAGIRLLGNRLKADFAYIPSSQAVALANTLWISAGYSPW